MKSFFKENFSSLAKGLIIYFIDNFGLIDCYTNSFFYSMNNFYFLENLILCKV